MFEFKLPDLGEGIHEGEILKWHVQPGDTIKEDEPLVDVETDKAAVTIPSPRGGKILTIAGNVGDKIRVGQVIVAIEDAATPAGQPAGYAGAGAASRGGDPAVAGATAPAAGAKAAGPAAPVTAAGRMAPAAPATRRVARELGIDIALVPGTGPAGRVTEDDVKRFASGRPASSATEAAGYAGASAPATAKPAGSAAGEAATGIPFLDIEPLPDFSLQGPVEREPIRSIRRKIARKLTTSMILVPHVAHMDEADVTELDEFRRKERERRAGQPGSKMSLLAFAVKAVAAGLVEMPVFNSSLDPLREEIIYKKFYHVGIAVDSGRGLVVPVIRDVDRKPIWTIAAEIEDLAARARDGKLEVAEMRGGTFTITNVGPLGGTGLIPTINYPEAAILGMGMARMKPVVHDGAIVARMVLPLTLCFDHRIADGADAARFMNALVRRLSDPLSWLLTA